MLSRRNVMRATVATAAMCLAPHVGAAVGDRVKVGMIGTSHAHAMGKWDTLRKLTDAFEVVGACEPDEKLREAAEKRGAFKDVPLVSEERLLATPGLQAVLVETGVAELVPTAMRVANAVPLHIHLEKPAGDDLAAFAKLMERVAQNRRALQMGYMFRGHPAFTFLFEAARSGLLGDVYEISGTMGKVVGAAERKALARFGGGMMFELGCHLLDATVTVLGKPARVTPYLRKTQADGLADNCVAVLEYEKAIATIRSAAVDVASGPHRQLTVAGTLGTAHLQPLEPAAVVLTLEKAAGGYAKGPQAVELAKPNTRYGDQLARFARVVRGEVGLDYSAERELMGQEVILRASGMM